MQTLKLTMAVEANRYNILDLAYLAITFTAITVY